MGGGKKVDYREHGAVIGENFHNYGSIDFGHSNLLTIGDNVTIAADALILLHDASTQFILQYEKMGRVEIGDYVFIGAKSIVLPNVKIGSHVIIGAGSVIAKDVPDDVVVAGNPPRIICSFDEYMDRNRELMKTSFVSDKYWKEKSIDDLLDERMVLIHGGIGFDK